MERPLALLLLSLALAGCVAPAPAAPREQATLAGAHPVTLPDPDPPPALPLPTAWQPLVAPPEPRFGDPPPPAASASAPAAANASASPPAAARPPARAKPAPGALPEWHVGDAWWYKGQDRRGTSYELARSVLGNGTQDGVPVYVERLEQGSERAYRNVTRAGLDEINGTGVVTELLRFPLAANATWAFGWDVWHNDSGPHYHQYWLGNVTVLAREPEAVTAGTFDAWRLHLGLVAGIGSLRHRMAADYWFADRAREIVRIDEHFDDGTSSWEELATADLA